MASVIRDIPNRTIQERAFAPGLVLMVCAIAVALIVTVLSSDLTHSFPYIYLLPWLVGLTACFAVPTAYLFYKGRLRFYDPLIFTTWVWFFPGFVIGGFMVTAGWSQPYFLTFIEDAEYNLPYTVVLIMLGYAGLALGYFSPLAVRVGTALGNYLPSRDFDSGALLVPGAFMLVLGTINTAIALSLGLFGFQRSHVVESYIGLIHILAHFWLVGGFVLLFSIFRRGKLDIRAVSGVLLFLGTAAARIMFAGSRGAILQAFLIVILAYLLSGGKFTFRRAAVAGMLLPICLTAGMIYGSTFRIVKGSEARISIDQYAADVFDTFDQVGRFDMAKSFEFAIMGLAERLDTISHVAVVVSSYEKLQPYEESYGLDNNIWKDTTTFLIPRIIWPDKPIASESRRYSDLYFGYGDSSMAITPFGDLLRNFGPIGVPIGMFIFGSILRLVYRSLIENQPRTMWRATTYFMILISISWETFYGLLVPFMFRFTFIAVVGILIIGLVARSLGHRRTAEPA